MSKSYNTGLAALVFLTGCLFLAPSQPLAQPLGLSTPSPQQSPGPAVLASPQGRYVFGQVSDSAKDQFMLDTATGRLWRISESGKIGIHLKAVPYCDEKGDCSPMPPRAPQ